MILLYGDESLDSSSSRVCAVGGLVGLEEHWANLESKWKALHGNIPFHANDCESNYGNYAPKPGEDENANNAANKELYKSSAILLKDSEIGGFAAAYDLAAQREVFPPPYAPPVYYQPFMDVIQFMGIFAEHREDQIEFTFDSRIESEHNAGLIYAHLRESNPQWKARFASKISFESSRNNARIQIADLFVREAMKAFDNEISPVRRPIRKSWQALWSTGRFMIYGFSKPYFEAAKKDIPNIDELLKFSNEDFTSWLTRKKRIWNVTNYFEFMMENLRSMSAEEKAEVANKLSKGW